MKGDITSSLNECWEMGRTGRSPEALLVAQALLVLARKQSDRPAEAFALTCNAWFCLQLGHAEDGVDYAIGARALFSELGDNNGLALVSAVYSWLMLELGLSDLAFEEARLALEIAERTDDLALRAFAMSIKGITLVMCREDKLAEAVLEEALDLADQVADANTIALNYISLGYSLANQAEAAEGPDGSDIVRRLRERSALAADRAATIARDAGDLWNLRTALCNGAELYALLGQGTVAAAYLSEWEAIGGQIGIREEIHYLYTKGEVLTLAGRLREALDICHRAERLASCGAQFDNKINSLRRLADIEAALGDFQSALGHYREFHDLYVKQMGALTRRRAQFAEMQLQSQRLRAKAVRFEAEAHQDVLTGLPNRRAFETAFAALDGTLFSLAILDLDHFKSVNDNFSHLVGDAVLTRTGSLLMGQGTGTRVFRLGGEEFALILPGVAVDDALPLVDAVRQALCDTYWADLGAGLAVTASAGLVDSEEFSGRVILAEADRRLYLAKNGGRNRVVGSDTDANLRTNALASSRKRARSASEKSWGS